MRAGHETDFGATAGNAPILFIALALEIFQQPARFFDCRRPDLKRFLADTIAGNGAPGHQVYKNIGEQANRLARVHPLTTINNVLVHYGELTAIYLRRQCIFILTVASSYFRRVGLGRVFPGLFGKGTDND